jgi:hypothetical protein
VTIVRHDLRQEHENLGDGVENGKKERAQPVEEAVHENSRDGGL